jgi:meso-butanediol dehydrogenase / (S,S)-butanediol dehydrogenase / diacetyl reductase
VACAGIAATGTVVDTTTELSRKMIDVNLTGVFLFAKAIIPFLENGGGTFTAIASDAGLNGFQGYAAYCASKHAVSGLIKSMALDHGAKGVRCNAICPGYVEMPMLDQLLAEMGSAFDEAAKAVPLALYQGTSNAAQHSRENRNGPHVNKPIHFGFRQHLRLH